MHVEMTALVLQNINTLIILTDFFFDITNSVVFLCRETMSYFWHIS